MIISLFFFNLQESAQEYGIDLTDDLPSQSATHVSIPANQIFLTAAEEIILQNQLGQNDNFNDLWDYQEYIRCLEIVTEMMQRR